MSKPRVVVILGPTASGKSDLAVKIARRFNGEVISADSRQIYKGLYIGSGKVTKKEMRRVPHHLLDIVSPQRTFTVAQYQKLGRAAIQKVLAKGKLPILCGGTGLYIDAIIHDSQFPPVPPDPKLRRRLEKETAEVLFAQLLVLDPKRAKTIDRHNKRRLIRALEIISKTGRAVPLLKKSSPYDVLKIGLKLHTETLKGNVRKRLALMMRRGLVAEVQKLRKQRLSWKRIESSGFGYREIGQYLQGKMTLGEAIKTIEQETWRYVKRQMTWFKRDKDIHWLRDLGEAFVLVKNFLKK